MDHLEGWRQESARFVDALDGAALDRPVPACPDWDVADLALHVGGVLDRFHRIAGDRLTEREQIRALGSAAPPADGTDLVDWFQDRVDDMDAVLAGLDPDEPVWNFTRSPHVGAWVARRMHHELVVHRHDLETAVGSTSPIPNEVAVDGIDELLTVLAPAGRRWEGPAPATLQTTDAATRRQWSLTFEPDEHAVPVEPDGPADVVARGDAPTLLLVLWRRRPLDAVAVTGDGELAAAMVAAVGR